MDPTKHNYYTKLMKLHEQGKIPTASLTEVDIYHDDGCGVHAGNYCNCDPKIQLRPNASASSDGNDGTRAEAGTTKGSIHEDTRPLEPPSTPCPHCGNKDFIIWQAPNDPTKQAISCNGCGAVMSSTHPLDPEDRPMWCP